jgi:hypothetical protein
MVHVIVKSEYNISGMGYAEIKDNFMMGVVTP